MVPHTQLRRHLRTFRITVLETNQHSLDSRNRLPTTKFITKLGTVLELVAANAT